MPDRHAIQRYRKWYAQLLGLYPRPYRDRFGEGMEQTFNDLLRERAEEKKGILSCALWMFVETSARIIGENMTSVITQNKRIVGMIMVIAVLLLIPLVAMQFTDEVDWSLADFVAAGVLLTGAGLTYELISRRMGDTAYRVAVGIAVGAALLLIWSNLAVGLIGSEDNPANVMYDGVLAVGIIGAVIARLRPQGMSRTLFAMAIAQVLVPVIALIVWNSPATSGAALFVTFRVTVFFVMLFVVSALLFRRASAAGSS